MGKNFRTSSSQYLSGNRPVVHEILQSNPKTEPGRFFCRPISYGSCHVSFLYHGRVHGSRSVALSKAALVGGFSSAAIVSKLLGDRNRLSDSTFDDRFRLLSLDLRIARQSSD